RHAGVPGAQPRTALLPPLGIEGVDERLTRRAPSVGGPLKVSHGASFENEGRRLLIKRPSDEIPDALGVVKPFSDGFRISDQRTEPLPVPGCFLLGGLRSRSRSSDCGKDFVHFP